LEYKRSFHHKTQTSSHAPPRTQAQAESVPAGESLALGIAPPSSTPNPDFSPFCATGLNKIKHLQLIF
jgi:hypothetical protein